MNRLRALLPWLIAGLLIYWLFQRYPLAEVIEATRYANWLAFGCFMVTYFALFSLLDIWSLHRTLGHYGVRGNLKQVGAIRLASNLAMILNYSLGQGALAYLLKRSFQDSFLRISSVLVLIIVADLYLAVTISFCGTFLTPIILDSFDLAPVIRLAWGAMTLGLLLLLALWHSGLGAKRIARLKAARVFYAINAGDARSYLALLLRRLPVLTLASTYFYVLCLCFEVSVPLHKVVALLPLTLIVSAIPITPGGLGTVQFATIYLFSGTISSTPITVGDVSPAEMLLAMSLLFTFSLYLLKLLSGAAFFPGTMKSREDGT